MYSNRIQSVCWSRIEVVLEPYNKCIIPRSVFDYVSLSIFNTLLYFDTCIVFEYVTPVFEYVSLSYLNTLLYSDTLCI